MPVTRKNCIVLDTSIFPKRPSVPDIKKFLEEELKLDFTTVKSVQPHNVKNVVYLAMQSEDAASSIVANHHLRHYMECDGKKLLIPLPIYVDSSAVDVRLHDLPEEISNLAISNHMNQYGEVFGVHNEVWKNYFPGLSNGVRVVRMQIKKPIPSYVTIESEITLVTHFLQVRTCKNCGGKSHPQFRCSEAAAKSQTQVDPIIQSPSTSQQSIKAVVAQTQIQNTEKQWPSLPKATTASTTAPTTKTTKNETKRQNSIDSDTADKSTKKFAPSTPNESDSSVIVIPDVSPARYRCVSYSWIEDEALRKQYLEEDQRRMNELKAQGFTLN